MERWHGLLLVHISLDFAHSVQGRVLTVRAPLACAVTACVASWWRRVSL